ncbi:exo-alpha-sialidase [Rhizobium leguminosarum]|nr:exo-alpha-sialidase [Rhizobium leguminosarum]NKK61557.1 exo-alpha-sialidase [Rhizobium leguminosarum bv. viciae]
MNVSVNLSETIAYRSSDPSAVFCYSPGIAMTHTGRIILTLDLGGDGVAQLQGSKAARDSGTRFGQGKVLGSDDGGATWFHLTDFPFWHARPIVVGSELYVLGQAGDIFIMRSRDDGRSWSDVHALTSGEKWNSAATNYLVEQDYIYLVMDHRADLSITGWNVAGLAPRVWRGRIDGDLLSRNNWTISQAPPFNQMIDESIGEHFGFPFYPTLKDRPVSLTDRVQSSPMGWLEGNIVRLSDPSHLWNDATGRVLHIFLRTNTAGSTGYAGVLRVHENDDGTMTTHHQISPSGRALTFVPFPGGHLKFFVLLDRLTGLYWLASSQATDSLCKPDALPDGRFNLPNNERHRLQLYWSKNCVDWNPAGLICVGHSERHARNYPSMIALGDDLLVACRSGDDESRDGQYTNLVTIHRVNNFRSLAV